MSEEYGSSSMRQLDGEEAPRTRTIFIDHLPPGHYELRAVLTRTDGQITTMQPFDIIAPGEDP